MDDLISRQAAEDWEQTAYLRQKRIDDMLIMLKAYEDWIRDNCGEDNLIAAVAASINALVEADRLKDPEKLFEKMKEGLKK